MKRKKRRKMVARANVQTTIYFPRRLDADQRVLLADLAIKEVINRTTVKKIGTNGKPFKAYSDSYKSSFEFKLAGKGKKPNLKLTGDMVHSIELISHEEGSLVIGYEPDDEIAGKVEGNQIGSYGKSAGNPAKARKFLGLPQRVVNILVAKVESATISKRLEAETSLIEGILSRVGTKEPGEE